MLLSEASVLVARELAATARLGAQHSGWHDDRVCLAVYPLPPPDGLRTLLLDGSARHRSSRLRARSEIL